MSPQPAAAKLARATTRIEAPWVCRGNTAGADQFPDRRGRFGEAFLDFEKLANVLLARPLQHMGTWGACSRLGALRQRQLPPGGGQTNSIE